ncbi:MAG: nitroreductase family protein [Firmicutes bacterium]|nr:nitroreductase family protein [Bacillota bacterium]
METMNAVLTRRSIRTFHPEPVEPLAIRTMIEAAMYAPSAGNQAPWRFVLIQNRETLMAIRRDHPYASALETAPMAILVCGATGDLPHPEFWSVDCAAATENLMLAAKDLGLGSVWIGLYPRRERMSALTSMLKLPADVEPFALIPVGHPMENVEEPQRYRPEWIRSEQWFEPWAPGRLDLKAEAEKQAEERKIAEALKRRDSGLHD